MNGLYMFCYILLVLIEVKFRFKYDAKSHLGGESEREIVLTESLTEPTMNVVQKLQG